MSSITSINAIGPVFLVFCLGSVLTASAVEQPQTSIMFGSLGEDEEIVMKLSSRGCFGYSSKHKFEFHRLPDAPSVVEVRVRDINGIRSHLVGTRRLEASDIEMLDKLLLFYRNPPEGHICTSVDQIDLTLYRKGKQVAEEQFLDGTCQSTSRTELMTLWQIIETVQPAPEEKNVVK